MSWIFDPLERGAYGLIMADPAWRFMVRSHAGITIKGAEGQYNCMALDDIKALPVKDLAARDCLLMLWVTNPLIDQQLPVLKAWGFTFVTLFTWNKKTENGKDSFGTGWWGRSSTEHIALAKRGSPRLVSRNERTGFEGIAAGHSIKPNRAYRLAERLVAPGTRKADLFSRFDRGGWESWGDQAGHMNWSR